MATDVLVVVMMNGLQEDSCGICNVGNDGGMIPFAINEINKNSPLRIDANIVAVLDDTDMERST